MRPSFLPIPIFLILIAILYLLPVPDSVFEPRWLLPVLNIIFVCGLYFVAASMAAKGYLATGSFSLLMLSCGVFQYGLSSLVAGWLISGGPNVNLIIHNSGVLSASIFHLIGALILFFPGLPEPGIQRKKFWLIFSFSGILLFVALLTLGAIEGRMIPFYIPGAGPTPVREAILEIALVAFAVSFLLVMRIYLMNRAKFLYWYSLALALIAVSISAILIQRVVGGPISWTGRTAQYAAGVYFLIATMTAVREAQEKGLAFGRFIADSFFPAEEKFRALAENSPDIIDRLDRELKHVYMNPAGFQLFGKPASAIIGKTIRERGMPEPYCSTWERRIKNVFESGKSGEVEESFPTAKGLRYFHSRLVPEFRRDGTVEFVLVISRDITERRQAQDALRVAQERTESILACITDSHIVWDHEWRYTYLNEAAVRAIGRPREQLLGHSLWDLYPETIGTEFERHSRYAMEKRVPVIFEYHYPGTETWWENRFYPIPEGLSAFATDITERKRAEKAHARSEERFRIAENVAVMGHFEWDIVKDSVVASPSLEAIHGLAPRAFRGGYEDWLAMVHPEDRMRLRQIVEKAFRKQLREQRSDFRIVRPNGEIRWITLRAIAEYGPEKKPVRVLGAMIDLTERKQAEEKVQQSELLFRSFFENSIDGIFLASLDGSIQKANSAACQILGRSEEDLIAFGKDRVLDISHPNSKKAREEWARTGKFRGELAYIRGDGTTFPVEISSVIYTDRAGQDRSLTIFRDITDRKRMEQELQRSRNELEMRVQERTAELAKVNEELLAENLGRKLSEEKLREQLVLIELAHDAILVRDMDDRIVFWNEGAEKTYGWVKDIAMGKVSHTFLQTRVPASPEKIRGAIIQKGYWEGELIHMSGEGREVFVESRQTLLRDAKAKPMRILEINRDITERKKAEEKVRESERQLKYLSSQLLLAQELERKRIAHDLHDGLAADLAAIKFSLERKLISKEGSSSGQMEAEEIISVIQRTIDDVRNIMNDLHPSILDDLGILPTISWYCRQFHSLYTDITVESKIAVREGEIPKLLNIPLYRVLQEAMNNAAKHSNANRVGISLTAENGTIQLIIEDNGQGFDVEEKYSLKGPKGLGLGSMKERVELSGGEFSIHSHPGKGTTIQARWHKTPEPV